MEPPTNRKGLQEFLGMINWKTHSKFVNRVRAIVEIAGKRSSMGLGRGTKEKFERWESLMTGVPVYAYYDMDKPVTVSEDASSTEVGKVVLQNGHPTAYASKAFTRSQKNYTQLKKNWLPYCLDAKYSTNIYVARNLWWKLTSNPYKAFSRNHWLKCHQVLLQLKG